MAHSPATMTSFRIGTINVHSFIHPKTLKRNAKELVSILAPYNLDVLAVQEVINDDDWILMCNDLSLTHTVFGASHGTRYGNAIGSSHPILDYFNQKIMTSGKGGDRAMLRCRLGGDHPFVQNRTFAVTHLDHLDEDERLKQINAFSPLSYNINILLGDMNALTRDDYSDTYFHENVVGKREKIRWEPPRFELTKQVVDTWCYQDAFRQINLTLKDENITTCAHNTRIDYIFLHPLPDDEWVLTECFIVDTHGATDHHAVVATFMPKNETFIRKT
ncbi:unnamed protein product [Rotaria socialis]|uniref:Endonuclease/exonuclease/phosphatase domain-containing protein n=1 Tax=Rotaria socialis TaxID=392032 RepID=A0A817VIV3_9BILA|nr:unnamed protein product [Rotaria socialis]CAF4462738.1 unnamed protein product [Rotaria socialis]